MNQQFTLYFGAHGSDGERRVLQQAEGLREYLPNHSHADRVLITRFLMGLNQLPRHESIDAEVFILTAIKRFEHGVNPALMATIESAWRNGF